MTARITLTDAQLRRLAAQYGQGASIRAIGELRGWSYGATHRRLTLAAEYGLVTMRPRGGQSKSIIGVVDGPAAHTAG